MAFTMLRALAHWELPLREASALAIRCGDAGRPAQLLAVDDERFQLAVAALAGGVDASGDAVDVATVVPGSAGNGGSDFEGVTSDASGRVFVLQERADRVVVFDRRLRAVEHVISLSVPRDDDLGSEWHDRSNARGEGLLLLRSGHVLVAKQRSKPRLVEFGPPGDAPSGFAPGDGLRPDETFPLDGCRAATFGVLASWLVDPRSDIDSVNDLALDERGRLHVVSATSRRLARVGRLDPRDGTASLTAWKLPKSLFKNDGKAEGLVLAPRLGWLVALDLGRHGPNLFQLDGVPA